MTLTYKTLGQADPAAATLTDAYTVPAATSAIVAGVVICNRTGAAATVRVAVSVGGGAIATKDYLCFDMPVPANSTITLNTGASLAAGDKLRVYSLLGSVSFSVFGVEIS